MIGNFAETVLLLYRDLYQPYVLERYPELISDEYQMALQLQRAKQLRENGEAAVWKLGWIVRKEN